MTDDDGIIELGSEWPKTQTGGSDDEECDPIIVAGDEDSDETTLSEFSG